MHKITIIDKNFEEKSLELNYSQLVELNKWLNIYLNSGKVFEGRIRKKILSNVHVEQKNIQM
jgi:hypothetical protein